MTDWLFMLGLLGVGLTVTFGFLHRFGALAGAAMMLLMWLASFPIAPNPFVDYHLVDLFLLLALAAIGADRFLGLGGLWQRLVRGNPSSSDLRARHHGEGSVSPGGETDPSS